MEKFQPCKEFHFEWPVNGDYPEAQLLDAHTGKPSKQICDTHNLAIDYPYLARPLDFSFASACHPDGYTIATANEGKTCRVWDVRNLSKSLAVLRGNLGAIRSIRFTSDRQFMAMAEPIDFVHIFDASSGYIQQQEVNFFGEISGMSFSPNTESLFIGIWDNSYGSRLQYNRNRNYSYLDRLL
ncbi:hypothetical protein ZIOFF_043153 [Zingiber officinale]|uniref:Uncharacterized protein n=1 Tax=Zingiber officinale TaxID=94328 RepID=A0A8J5FSS6_ZINOF|nr:hypothetical protein ZIOFF_043153 [Zingiber officinale]